MRFEGWGQLFFVFAVGVYQLTLSKVLRKRIQCRFHPSCSEYGILAVEKYGFREGFRKTVRRIARCRPSNQESCMDFP